MLVSFFDLVTFTTKVIIFGMLAHYLSGIHIILRENKETTAILQFIKSIRKRCSCFHRNNRTINTSLNFSFVKVDIL